VKLDVKAIAYRTPPHHDPDDHDLPTRLAQWPPLARYLVSELQRDGIAQDRAARMVVTAWHNAGAGPSPIATVAP